VRQYLGPELVECFLPTRRAEQHAFDRWWRTSVSEWELARCPVHI